MKIAGKVNKRTLAGQTAPLVNYKVGLIPILYNTDYEALVKTPAGAIIGRSIASGNLVVIDSNFNVVKKLNSQGLFYLASAAVLLSSGTLIIYNQGKIYRSVDTTYTSFTVVLTLNANCSILINRGLDKAANDNLMFGEYITSARTTPAICRLWLGTNDGQTWASVHTFSRDEADPASITHIHTCCYDKYSDTFWIGTGDGSQDLEDRYAAVNNECKICQINKDGTNFRIVAMGVQDNRAVGFVFSPSYVIYGNDGGTYYDGVNLRSGFFRMNRQTLAIERMRNDIANFNYGAYSVQTSYGEVYLVCGDASAEFPLAPIWISNGDGDVWENVLGFPKATNASYYAQIQRILDIGNDTVLACGESLNYDKNNYVVLSVKLKLVGIADKG
jgi:hypothetical protein